MSGILAPDGILARKTEIAMKGRHAKWLIDGLSFLEHLPDLAPLKLVAVCRACLRAGLDARVAATVRADRQQVSVRCGHHAGLVKTAAALDVPPLLDALGWSLQCPDCGESVRGDNLPTASRFTVDCACTSRVYQIARA